MTERFDSPADEVLEEKLNRVHRRRARWGLLAGLAATAAAVCLLLGAVFGLVIVKGPSMEPTFPSGRPVLLLRLAREFHSGDVVVFKTAEGEVLIKRVAAVAGDGVAVSHDGSSALIGGNIYGPAKTDDFPPPQRVPEGAVFVLGDNLALSKDSRNWGMLPIRQIFGKVIA